MATSISISLRTLLRERAKNRCEYCLLPQSLALHKHEPDHIVPVQHGGVNDEENLALSCMRCNRFKGPNVGSFDMDTGKLVPFLSEPAANHPSADAEFLLSMAGTVETDEQDTSEHVYEIVRASVEKKKSSNALRIF